MPSELRRSGRRISARVVSSPTDAFRGRTSGTSTNTRREGLAPNTQKRICGVFNVLESLIGPKTLGQLSRETLDAYASKLREAGRSESTIKSHLAHIRAAMSWAVERGYLYSVPKMPKIQRAKTRKVMRGRPITTEEFERMLDKVPDVIRQPNLGKRKEKPPTDWQRVPGLATSTQRAVVERTADPEALELSWDDESRLLVELSYQRPMLRIPAEREKGHKDRLLPIAPEFAEFLLKTPKSQRRGFVFDPRPMLERDGRLRKQQVERTIAASAEPPMWWWIRGGRPPRRTTCAGRSGYGGPVGLCRKS